MFEETRIEHEETNEIAEILQGRPVDEELLVEYPGGTIVSGVIDEIRENYDYIGIDEPLYRKREDYILHVHDVIQNGREEIGPGRLLALNSREKPKRIMDSNGNVIWGLHITNIRVTDGERG
ncbi:transposase [Selenomonas ruminantium]|uniref:transposase n=1 Tax=Selenomonas ruminantium TaxID=971 RepID=UPI00115FF434|nr:transposase [Selenomonas ruminantium]